MTYTAHVTREDGMWTGEVPNLPGAHAYARTLSRLREELADAIILAADLDDDTQVDITFTTAIDEQPDDVTGVTLIAKAFDLANTRRQIREATELLTAETARIAALLIGKGWSVRDTAGALDITPGRISQLVNPDNTTKPKQSPKTVFVDAGGPTTRVTSTTGRHLPTKKVARRAVTKAAAKKATTRAKTR